MAVLESMKVKLIDFKSCTWQHLHVPMRQLLHSNWHQCQYCKTWMYVRVPACSHTPWCPQIAVGKMRALPPELALHVCCCEYSSAADGIRKIGLLCTCCHNHRH